MSHQPPCHLCDAKCCRHVALEIDKPTSKKDFDNIRWYLIHKNVSVFIDNNKGWFVKFDSPCEHITDVNNCGYYEERPKICRDYPAEGEACEFEGEDDYYIEMFDTEEEFLEYLARKSRKWKYKNL